MVETQQIEKVGTWWNSNNIELMKIDGEVFALHGWNGESFLNCWKVLDDELTRASEENYTITPHYEFNYENNEVKSGKLKYMEITKN
mgnify:CR=1 FL=1